MTGRARQADCFQMSFGELPGEMLFEEFLEPLGMSQAEFARRIVWTKARLNERIRGKRGITAEAALDLVDALEFRQNSG